MPQVFISYSHKDRSFVGELARQLQNRGFDMWVDADGIHTGDNWRDTIDNAIRNSSAVIVVLTPDACESKYVTYEWSFALGLGIPVLPIMHRKGGKIHEKLDIAHYMEFDKDDPYSHPWDKLADELRLFRIEKPSVEGIRCTLELLAEYSRSKREMHDMSNALDTLKDALKIAPETLLDEVHYEISQIYVKQGQFDLAEEHLNKALAHNAKNTNVLRAAGELARRRADKAEEATQRTKFLSMAEARFLEALDLQKDLLDESGESVWASLGGICKRKGDLEAAIEHYEKAARYVPHSSYPLTNLGLLYMQKNDLARVRIIFRRVERFAQATIAQRPGDSWAYNDLLTARIVLDKLDGTQGAQDAREDVISFMTPDTYQGIKGTLETLLNVEGLTDETRAFITETLDELAKHAANLVTGGD